MGTLTHSPFSVKELRSRSRRKSMLSPKTAVETVLKICYTVENLGASDPRRDTSMLRWKCLVLDHDDTVVQSEATVNYPFFVEFLREYRPDMTITAHEYISECFHPGYGDMCRRRFGLTQAEMEIEYRAWKEYIKTHVPAAYPGMERIIRRQKEAGGLVCVISQSAQENILRDYAVHFGIIPDAVYGWDTEPQHRKPSPWALTQIMRQYALTPEDILVLDDMKQAVPMARGVGVAIGFAGWGRADFPEIVEEMGHLCDYSFLSTASLEDFLFNAPQQV